ncbi:MAG TPA: excalibur calcium-binding domain-containing protein [Dehalococcoidia bacterium]|nr:excalibur calcium-binding domain-containing protein [Dehalococcoidia bacterium]
MRFRGPHTLAEKLLGAALILLALVVAGVATGVIAFTGISHPSQVAELPPGRVEYNCGDFLTYAEAKAVFDAYPGDPYRLDGNEDGIPCEGLPGAPKR